MAEPETAFPPPDQYQKRQLGKMQEIFLEALRHREQEFLKYAVILVSAIGVFLYVVSDYKWAASTEVTKQETKATEVAVQQGHTTGSGTQETTLERIQSQESKTPSSPAQIGQLSSASTQTAKATEAGTQKSQSATSADQETQTDTTTTQETRSFALGVEQREDVKCTISVFSALALYLGAVYCIALGYNYRYLTLQVAKIECALGLDRYMLADWPRRPADFIKKVKSHGKSRAFLQPPEVIRAFYWACIVGIVAVGLVNLVFVTCSWVLKGLVTVFDIVLVVDCICVAFRYGTKFVKLCQKEPPWPEKCSGSAQTQ